MQNADTLLPEDTLDIKIFDRKCPTNFTSTVIPETRCAQPKAGIRNVELVPIAPRPALFDFDTLKADVPRAKLPLDEIRNGAVLDEFRKCKALLPKARCDVQHVRLRAGRLHIKQVAVLYRHPLRRRDAHTHARRTREGVAVVLLCIHRLLLKCCGIALNRFRVGALRRVAFAERCG